MQSPINPGINLKPFLSCKDYTVSRETFQLLLDDKAELLITSPQPKLDELGKYYESDAYISHTDSSKSFTDKLYQAAKKYAIHKKVTLVKQFISSSNPKLLDVGCGTGDFLQACKKSNFKTVGVEPNTKARNIALSKTENQIFDTLFNLPSKEKFDVITLWHVLEHVPDLNHYIQKLKALLNENGVLIIAVPNYKSYDATYYNEFWAAYDVPRHLWHFSKKSISLLFEPVSLKVIKILPMKLDAFYVSLLSEKYKTEKTNFIKAFWIGLKSNFKAKKTNEYSSHIYVLKNK